MTATLTPSEKALIADMAAALIASGADLGDERSVEMALRFGYMADQADIDQHMRAAIDRARALRVLDREFSTLTIG